MKIRKRPLRTAANNTKWPAFEWQGKNDVHKSCCLQAAAQRIYDVTCATDKVGTTLSMLYVNPAKHDFCLRSHGIRQDLKTADFRGKLVQSVF